MQYDSHQKVKIKYYSMSKTWLAILDVVGQ